MRVLLILFSVVCLFAQTTRIVSGRRYPRLIVRNATIIEGNGTPASGPKDIVIENGRITDIVALDPVALSRGTGRRPAGDVEIDARGKYVMPGLINAHAHIQDERGGIPQPVDYELKIWMACGITTVRDVGSDTRKTLQLRKQSAEDEIVAPRIFVYPMFNQTPTPRNGDEGRARVREFKAMGVDGIKILGIYRDVMEAMEDEAHKNGLRIAHHAGVEETNAWDDSSEPPASSTGTAFPTRRLRAAVRISPPPTITTTKPTASVTPAISGAKRITTCLPKSSTGWWLPMSPGTRPWTSTKPAAT